MNVMRNNLQNVKLFMVALDEKNSERTLIGSILCKARKLDTILLEENVKISSHDLIKIDVEGMALNVLRGGLVMLKESKPRLIIELHKGEESVENLLKKLGYRLLKPANRYIVAF